MTANVRSLGSIGRSTAWVHRAGAAAILGAIALALSLLGHELAGYLGINGTIDTPGTLGFLLSYASLAFAWGLLFLGSLGLAAILLRSDRRAVRIGAVAVSLGLAGAALGFGFAALASLAGLGGGAMIGETIAAPSLMVILTVGSLVLGVSLLRTDAGAVSRRIAWLIAATGPSMVLGAFLGVPVLGPVLFAGPLCAAWILIGRDLLATDASATVDEPATIPT